jgi:hypothetical protein
MWPELVCLTDVVHVSMSGEERPQLTQLLEAAQRRTITSLGNQRRNKVRDWLFGYSVGRSISTRHNRSVYLHQKLSLRLSPSETIVPSISIKSNRSVYLHQKQSFRLSP